MSKTNNGENSDQLLIEIQLKVRNNLYSTKPKSASPSTRKRFKSTIWEKFENILNEKGKQVPDAVICKFCKKVLRYDSLKLGTGHLRRHNCAESFNASYRSECIDNFMENPEKIRRVGDPDKQLVKNGCLRFVVKDIRPISAIEGDGLINLLSTFTTIGKKHGSLSPTEVAQILPHPTTVNKKFYSYSHK